MGFYFINMMIIKIIIFYYQFWQILRMYFKKKIRLNVVNFQTFLNQLKQFINSSIRIIMQYQ